LTHRWQLLYHDFSTRALCATRHARADEIAAALGLAADETAVLLVTVLWRSGQRYGARGYRYCLLDAGHVLGNLARTAAHFGGAAISLATPAEIERRLDLRDGEALVAGLRLRLPSATPAAPPAPPLPAPVADGAAGVQSPPLSPVLRRIIRFHRMTLLASRAKLPLVSVAPGGGDFERLADARDSAAAFAPEPLTSTVRERLVEVARHSAHAASTPLQIIGVDLDRADRAAAFGIACQRQRIVTESPFLLVVAAPVAAVRIGGYAGYREAVLHAGVVCSQLYHEAARRGVATTSIGGFSDDHVARLTGLRASLPIVVQAFGVEGGGIAKLDAVRMVPSNVIQLRKDRSNES
jgi:nitroreductase